MSRENYIKFEKYSYFKVSDPNSSFWTKLQTFWQINSKSSFRSAYNADANAILHMDEVSLIDRTKMSSYIKGSHICDYLSLVIVGLSVRKHYKLGYLNTDSRLVDVYLASKFLFYLFFIFSAKFFVFKWLCDPILYDVYTKIEYKNALYSKKLTEESSRIRELTMIKSKERKN